jgi:hypothetical protein
MCPPLSDNSPALIIVARRRAQRLPRRREARVTDGNYHPVTSMTTFPIALRSATYLSAAPVSASANRAPM